MVFNFIQSRGGRFLKLVESANPAVSIIENGVWLEVEEAVALEKCKQALRGREKKGSSDSTNLPPLSGHESVLQNFDSAMLGADPVAIAIMLKRRQAEKQLLMTRMLLQQREQDELDEAYLAVSNASSSGSMIGRAIYSDHDPRMQALLQQGRQMEDGLLPPQGAGLISIPQRPNLDLTRLPHHDVARFGMKKLSIDQKPHVDASQDQNDIDEVKKDTKPQCGGKGEPFPQKLHRMLEEAEKNDQEHVLSFSPCGRAFAIHQPRKFMEVIMPRYFGTTRMSSFQRQLQIYGFRRVVTEGRDKGSYYHEFFLKGQEELALKIKRKISPGLKPSSSNQDLEEAVEAYRQVMSGAGAGIGIPASQRMLHNSSRQQDLISKCLMTNGGGQRPGSGNSLSRLSQTSAMDASSDSRMSLASLVQRGNGAARSHLLAAGIDMSGLIGDPTTVALLRKQQQSELLLAQLQHRNQKMADLLHLLS
jgi:hypothetical protein